MGKIFLEKNIIMIGDFKPSNYDKLFFIKNEILKEDEILESSIFLPNSSYIETNEYIIDIIDFRIAITFKNNDLTIKQLNIDKFINDIYVKKYGFNFKWALFIDDIITESKKLFYFKENKLNNFFDDTTAAYGYYVSSDYENSRLRLEVNPIELFSKIGEKSKNALQFDFNFHFKDDDSFSQSIEKFESFEEYAKLIIKEYE
ncbi:hypothetical protein OK18_14580 [Chryseobacterium gallinarum]|uniref:Uncharacterized protein n=1 Tax=Chryseobacterium gallinarum TaxID=1324352 RepID=A0A0G3M495_CHRGL|nr:hypothetical protein [Chryseobacterium gallinarum]AKK73664.1 hypothetical protein OK18_14580 [Chryseobacterium gallinarum]